MLFNSFEYALFLPLVLVLYWTVLRKRQNALLLAASYVFYGSWDYRFLSLIIVSTLTDFWVARRLAVTDADRRRRGLLAISVAVNLGILAAFKYFNFFVDSFAEMLSGLGFEPSFVTLQVLLPVGISFYTFQTLGYTLDVYRRQMEPVRNLLTFSVYVAYFPQLVAGPIERARRLVPQFRKARTRLSASAVRSGVLLILIGLFKKVVIADGLAGSVDAAFGDAASAGAVRLLVNLYAFALQIYGDFSGYTDIARGSSRLMGIELMENFNQPYLSVNISHFWRTWHMSLSSWLRDYLYIPLGGNQRGARRTYINLMLTMLIGGLWHGAAWTFVVWGGLHGAYLAVHRRYRSAAPKGEKDPFTRRDILPALATFHVVCLSWIFFRAVDFTQAADYLLGILTLRAGPIDSNAISLLIPAALAMLTIDLVQRNSADELILLRWAPAARGIAYGVMLLALVVFSGGDTVPFIYFQF